MPLNPKPAKPPRPTLTGPCPSALCGFRPPPFFAICFCLFFWEGLFFFFFGGGVYGVVVKGLGIVGGLGCRFLEGLMVQKVKGMGFGGGLDLENARVKG